MTCPALESSRRSPFRTLWRSAFALTLLAAALGMPSPAASQRGPQSAGPNGAGGVVYEGWYVVRPGDTLESITARYLGDAQRWQENWRLNPELADPHNLRPGQRLRILLRSIPDEGALLTQTSNRVEDQLPPLAWQEARRGDVLRPRDSVRTFEASSAELTFGDDTRLVLSEDSLVFLDRESSAGPSPLARDQIEIVVGQADLDGRGVGGTGEAIELVIGDAVAVPEPSSAGQVQTRARRADAGAQLMAYEGGSKLAAAGVEIEVPQGMGSAVAEGAPPGPPEVLLPAPELVSPADGARLPTPRPELVWKAVEGASGYVLEVCRDAACAQLVARATVSTTDSTTVSATDSTSVSGTGTGSAPEGDASSGFERWRPEGTLPVADLFWRVTAVRPSGLDGYPSGTRAVTVTSDIEDETPPVTGFGVDGVHLPPRTGLNATWILGLGGTLEATPEDAESGVERIEYVLDGQPVSEEAWSGPWTPGLHEASYVAVDGVGNRAVLEPVSFHYDVEPPAISWGVEGLGRLGDVAASEGAERPQPAASRRAKRRIEVDDPHSLWPWRTQLWTVRHDGHQVTLTPSRPVVVTVESSSGERASDDITTVLGPGRGLWVLAEDAVCGPSLRLDYELDVDAERAGVFARRGLLTLRLGAEDGVDNAAGATLRLVTSRADREARSHLPSE